jgi:hypothetical protein
MIDAEKVMDCYTKHLSPVKWEVINRASNGMQVRQIKRMNRLGFWAGLLLIPFWGIGFIIWLLVLLDYALQREKIKFITVDQMIKQLKQEAK